MSIRGLLLLASVLFRASAGPITWTLSGVTSLGASITGSFVYDADTFTLSSIDITTVGGTVIPAETWTVEGRCCPTDNEAIELVGSSAVNQAGGDLLVLLFGVAPGELFLTDAGGSLPIRDTQEGTCLDYNCTEFSGSTNYDVTGAVIATVEPASVSLLILGACLLRTRAKRARC